MKRIITLIFACCVLGFSARAQISFTGYYFQDFDSLANSGTTASTMPYGWAFLETGTGANTTYGIDYGIATSGNTYSYGTTSSTDRALGALASNSTQAIFGVSFTNNTGAEVDNLTITYKIEQWRLGSNTTGRPTDSLWAEISPLATSLSSVGVWQKVPELNIYSVVTSGTVGALNGNNSSNYVVVTKTFNNLNITNGTTVWIRWTDANITGSDDALAIDSFTLEIPKTAVSFASTGATVQEGDSAKVTLSIKNENASSTTVKVAVSSGSTATVTSDYVYTGTSYTFTGGSSADIEFWVKTVDDSKIEKTESLILMLMDPTNNAILGDSIFTLTILDDDTIQVYDIEDVKFPLTNGMPDTTKYGVFHGIVTTPDFDESTGIQFAIKDSTGAIGVVNPITNLGYTVKMGDSVFVRAKVASAYYYTYLFPDSISVLSTGNTVPSPTVTTTLNDNNESELVTLKRVKLVDPSKWGATTGSGGFNVQVTNGSKIFDILIDESTDLFTAPAPEFFFDISGVAVQIGIAGPTSGYFVMPRGKMDITEIHYPMYKIAQLKGVNSNGVPDSLNVKAWVKGVVQSPTYRTGGLEFSLQDSTGGIIIFNSNRTFGYTPNVGDSVMALGTVVQFNGLTELTLASSDTLVKLVSSGFPIAAQTITTYSETYEGSLVRLENVTLVDATKWTTGVGSSGFNVDVTNGTDTFIVRVDKDVEVFNADAPTGRFNVTGVLTQFDNSSPYTTGYQLLPRFNSDIELIVEPEPVYNEYKIAELKPYNATTGVADSIGVKAWIRGVVYSEDFEGDFFAIADSTAAITVMMGSNAYNPVRGDSIRVLGTIGQLNGQTYISADSVIVLNSGNSLMAPVTVTAFQEVNESKLVQLNYIQFVAKSGDLMIFTNGTNNFFVKKAANVDLPNLDSTDRINIRGILVQMDTLAPYLDTYVLMPRDSFDLDIVTSVEERNKQVLNIKYYPNPATTNVNIVSDFVADRISVADVTGKEVLRYIPVSTNARIDVSSLKAGMYMIRVQKDGAISTHKLYKQ